MHAAEARDRGRVDEAGGSVDEIIDEGACGRSK
jgi:hypothetical protein